MMFLEISDNRTGEPLLLRRISPTENKTAREYVKEWIAREYDGYGAVAFFSEPGSHIPNGCGDFQAEIRRTKESSGSCLESEPFFVEMESE